MDDRFEVFCETLYPTESGILSDMEKYALTHDVPIIRPAARRYLRWLIATIRPEMILELGTAIGFSAIMMAETAPEAHITTIESYEPRIQLAKENIARAGLPDRITLLFGDAAELLDTLHETDIYDLVFIDAAKAQYATYLKLVLSHLHSGSVIVFDNVLAQDSGSTLDSRYAIERRDRTIHERMRTLLHEVTSDARFATELSAAGDGMLTVTLK